MAHNHDGVPDSTSGPATKTMDAETRKLLYLLALLDVKSAYTLYNKNRAMGCAMCGYYKFGCWNC